jgi:outer membrane receptor protein involved in Fe transport
MMFSRRATRVCALVWLAILGALGTPLAAQTAGTIQGRVADATGRPLVGAQVIIVGTTLGNLTNEEGYYFINNVPAGIHNIQAQLIGYRAVTVRQQGVLAGQTLTVNFTLEQAAVELQAIEIVGERRPLVPRDQVGSKNIVTGELIQQLPIDNVAQVLVLQPGVVGTGAVGKGISIRGGRSGEEAVYLDGLLLRNFNAGDSNIRVAPGSLAELDVLTGGFSAEFGQAQSGIINYVTRAGVQRWSGSASFESDEFMPDKWSRGFNRGAVSLGGPLFGRLSFFGAAAAEGRRSSDNGKLWPDVPIYVASGIDTVVTIPAEAGSTGQTDDRNVVIPKFEPFDEGGRSPFSNSDEYALDGKVDYTYGTGSRFFITAKSSRSQARSNLAGSSLIFNPNSYGGTLNRNTAFILGWNHNFVRSAESALALDLKIARTDDKRISGALDPEYEVSHRDPFLGFTTDDLQFLVDEKGLPVDETLVDNFLRNEGRRTVFDPSRTDIRLAQEFRMNPYGVRTGFSTTGISQGFTFAQEKQWQVRATVDWQADRFNRVKFGGDYTVVDIAAASIGLITQSFADVWVEKPKLASLFVQDRVDLGDLVVEGGLRWDRFDPATDFPVTAGFYDPDDPATFRRAKVRNKLSPRLGISFPVTVNSTFRLSYGHFVQLPDLNEYYQGKNVDYSRFRNTNTNDIFGRPLDLGKTIAFEFGYRMLLAPDFVLDLSAYNRDKVSDVAIRKLAWEDPTNPGVVNYLNTITNADFGSIRGVDLRLDRRFGRVFDVMLGYSFQDARNTGTDPYTYTDLFARIEGNANTLLGLPPNPAQAIRTTEENRKHNVTGSFSLQFPSDWSAPALRNLGVAGTLRFASGLPYSPVTNVGEALVTGPPTDIFSGELRDDEISTAAMPWIRNFDLRVTKGVNVSGLNARVFLDARNLLNLENRTGIFLTTGDIIDDDAFDRIVASHRQELGGGTAVDEVDLASLDAAGDGVATMVDLVLLRRAEARFGNGDGIFSAAEQDAAFRAAELFRNGPQTLVGPGRRVRLGFELVF